MIEHVLPVMYKAFSLAGLMPVVLVAVTQSSYWALGSRSVTVQWVSFTFTTLTENHAGHLDEATRLRVVSWCNVQSWSCTLRRVGAVCGGVLQHRSVVKLVVLHGVIGEQAPANTQGRLRGRVGRLRVDDWGRRSCVHIGDKCYYTF